MVEGFSVITKKPLDEPKILPTNNVNYVQKKRNSDNFI